jgi:hypothetical protein
MNLFSQGFNWQYSSRLPFESPNLFIGLEGNYSIINSSGEFPFVENRWTCCEFNEGTGSDLKFGLNSEYWITGSSALKAGVFYSSFLGDFSKITEERVNINAEYLEQFKYSFETVQHFINLKLGYKYKLLPTHISLVTSLNIDYLFFEQNESTESRIGPVDKVQPYSRSIAEGRIKGIRNLYLSPEIGLAYDVNLGNGLYSSIQVLADLPLMSFSSAAEWRKWQYGIGIAIYKGFIVK